jgi:uncharacterized protein (UPF0335 family)
MNKGGIVEQKLKNMIESAAVLMEEENQIKEQRKELAKTAKEEFDIKPALFNRVVKVVHKQNFSDEMDEVAAFTEMLTSLLNKG